MIGFTKALVSLCITVVMVCIILAICDFLVGDTDPALVKLSFGGCVVGAGMALFFWCSYDA
jgi:hypothetical protein